MQFGSLRNFLAVEMGLLGALSLSAQPSHPRFEVATLKVSTPAQGDLINVNLGSFRRGRLTMGNVTLNDAIKFAYDLVSEEQLVGLSWNREVRFDIEALAPLETSQEQLRLMTQDLLAERLGLVVRREQKNLRHMALVVGKETPKLPRAKPEELPNPGPQVRGRISHPQMTMGRLVALLSRFERLTIVDLTGLTGLFEVNL